MSKSTFSGQFAFKGTNLLANQIGYGVMPLAGPHVFSPPKDDESTTAILRLEFDAIGEMDE